MNSYFWRTYDQQEIDLIEEKGGVLEAFEFKWTQEGKVPVAFSKAYPGTRFSSINSKNYLDFIV